ncbi:MAG TPA: penicillin-binding protein 2 [Ignavibacteriales bacterium]|nr:penicillin-binding protein 2 [Ignavibacteriales bacterium]
MNNSRLLISVSLFFVILVIIIVRLVNVQIINHEEYLFKAEKQQFKTKEVPANRGLIFDSNGDILAYNINVVDFYVDTRMCNEKRKDTIAGKFASVLGGKKEEYLKILNSANKNVLLANDVTLDKALELKNFVIDGLFYEEKQIRKYPFNNLASHVIGYINKEQKAVDGIERAFDEKLRGKPGLIYFERDVKGRIVQVQNDLSVNPVDGANLYLTINRVYQQILEEELQKGIAKFSAKFGVGIIMNPENGDILAMTSLPSFDPNEYNKYDLELLRNKAISDLYEPGSTFKSIAMATFIDNSLIRDNEIINCAGGLLKVNDVTIKDDHAVGNVTPKEILAYSSNVGMSKLSTRIDKENFYLYLRNFGFGNVTSCGLNGEVKGILLKPEKINEIYKMFMSFGYSVSVTPIQMATAYCALVNGGTLYQPRLVSKIVYKNNQVEEISPKAIRKCISEKTSSKIRDYMRSVVTIGTARKAFEDFNLVEVGGKTGTAQIIVDKKHTSAKHNSSFIGFLPLNNPKLVCYILVSQPQGGYAGGQVAAPIFKNVVRKILLINDDLLPKDKKYLAYKIDTSLLYNDISNIMPKVKNNKNNKKK